jgi:CheY-like chemotaxis protein
VTKLSVLAIDDESDLLELIRQYLVRFGDMNVETTISTKEALTRVLKSEYDVIIVDYYMPEITGIEFLKILRAKGDTTPVIIFTGVGRELAAIEALNNGADFFLQKGDDPKNQFRELVHMIRQAKERRSVGKSMGTSQRIISDVMSFTPEPMMAIDREGIVIAWNAAMEEMTGVTADFMVGKTDKAYSEIFFGKKRPMPIDLIFSPDSELASWNYNIVSREKGVTIVWTRATKPDEKEKILWMRAMPLKDGKGSYMGAVGSVRDITDIASTLIKEPVASITGQAEQAPPTAATAGTGGFFDRLTGKAKTEYRAGVRSYYNDGNYDEALAHFDRAIEIDPTLSHVWNERGLCLKDMGKYEDAIKSYERAIDLAPNEEEYLYDYAEVLEIMGILLRQRKFLDLAVRTFARVTEINPNNASAWNHMGICIKESGKDEESRQAFERARTIQRTKKEKMFRRKRESIL